MEQGIIDGAKSIIQNPSESQKSHPQCTFEANEVYCIDILLSTGTGAARARDTRTTVFKRTEAVYQLKLNTSRVFFREVSQKFGKMPFSLRAFGDENKARMGVQECVKHGLLAPFEVLYEANGAPAAAIAAARRTQCPDGGRAARHRPLHAMQMRTWHSANSRCW